MSSQSSSDREAERARSQSLSRRSFLRASAAVGGGLLVAFGFPPLTRMGQAAAAEGFPPNGFIRIDRDGRVTIIVCQVEMGQGTFTSCPMLVAEELEVDLSQVQTEQAPPSETLYRNQIVGMQMTGGSTSIRAFYGPLRRAGATAREMLIAAAAATWNVDTNTCRAETGSVIHTATGRKLDYGALADKAATMPVPKDVALKDPKDFKLIGTPAKRLDTPDKVNGKTVYGIDVKVLGMKVGSIAICPVFGGKLKSVDDSKALSVKDVLQVVRVSDAVAVIASHTGAANKGLAALATEWGAGPNAKLSTADIVADMAKASEADGATVRRDGDVAEALVGSKQKLDAIYQVPFLAHTTMEPLNCTVDVRKDACEIWVGIQVMSRAQAVAAELTGLPPKKLQYTTICSVAASVAVSRSISSQRLWRSPNKSRDR